MPSYKNWNEKLEASFEYDTTHALSRLSFEASLQAEEVFKELGINVDDLKRLSNRAEAVLYLTTEYVQGTTDIILSASYTQSEFTSDLFIPLEVFKEYYPTMILLGINEISPITGQMPDTLYQVIVNIFKNLT